QLRIRQSPQTLTPRVERLTVEILHYHEAVVVVAEPPHVQNFEDVIVADATCGLRLALEPLDGRCVRSHHPMQHLDRHTPGDHDVLALVDGAHPTLANQARDAVLFLDQIPRVETHGMYLRLVCTIALRAVPSQYAR